MKRLSLILILIFAVHIRLFSQVESNLTITQKLIDSSCVLITKVLSNANKIKLEITTPPNLVYLHNSILKSFSENITLSDSASILIKYNLDKVEVAYTNLEKENVLGNYHAERNIKISGNYIVFKNGESILSDNFLLSHKDNCLMEELSGLENPTLPFTQGKIPSEPFLSGLFEPIIAVSAIAVSIYLLFSVRSK